MSMNPLVNHLANMATHSALLSGPDGKLLSLLEYQNHLWFLVMTWGPYFHILSRIPSQYTHKSHNYYSISIIIIIVDILTIFYLISPIHGSAQEGYWGCQHCEQNKTPRFTHLPYCHSESVDDDNDGVDSDDRGDDVDDEDSAGLTVHQVVQIVEWEWQTKMYRCTAKARKWDIRV